LSFPLLVRTHRQATMIMTSMRIGLPILNPRIRAWVKDLLLSSSENRNVMVDYTIASLFLLPLLSPFLPLFVASSLLLSSLYHSSSLSHSHFLSPSLYLCITLSLSLFSSLSPFIPKGNTINNKNYYRQNDCIQHKKDFNINNKPHPKHHHHHHVIQLRSRLTIIAGTSFLRHTPFTR
jgi:hypothetical protein